MKDLLLTYRGRINRAKIWMALLYYIGIGVAVGVLFMILAQLLPGDVDEDGLPTFGAKSLPMIVLGLAYLVFSVWSGICVGIKRFHDRDKSGWWLLIQLVPVIGPIWYFVEVFCLKGTTGANRFGPDPLETTAAPQA